MSCIDEEESSETGNRIYPSALQKRISLQLVLTGRKLIIRGRQNLITRYQKIKSKIESVIRSGNRNNFLIYPFGEYGVLTKQILNYCYGVKEAYIIDNMLSEFNKDIKNLRFCESLDCTNFTVLFTCSNQDIRGEAMDSLLQYFEKKNIVDVFAAGETIFTDCGKYSYGPLCDHIYVESVGAFCSFAEGTDVVPNHPVRYISTSPFLYAGSEKDRTYSRKYEEYKNENWYFADVIPKGMPDKTKRVKIKNDVWLGKNVIITNGAEIGNGVIAGAGAVITKDVPDYAVVAGVPAKIIRYRYEKEQIKSLNRIAWWDWPDEKIRASFYDFYLDIQDFIEKHQID